MSTLRITVNGAAQIVQLGTLSAAVNQQITAAAINSAASAAAAATSAGNAATSAASATAAETSVGAAATSAVSAASAAAASQSAAAASAATVAGQVSTATGAATTATGQAVIATSAAASASGSAAAAAAASKAYPTTAAALADGSLAVGSSFSAPLVDGSFQAYTKTSISVATAFGAPFPKAADVQELQSTFPAIAPPSYVYAILDNANKAALGIIADGTTVVAKLQVTGDVSLGGNLSLVGTFTVPNLSAQALSTGAAVNSEQFSVPGYEVAWIDKWGYVAGGIESNGTLSFEAAALDNLTIETINGVPVAAAIPKSQPSYAGNFQAEVVHVMSYGQSLSLGYFGTPALSTTQRFDNLMFNAGMRPGDDGTDGPGYPNPPATTHASLVPAVESNSADLGETFVSGLCEQVKELILSESGISYSHQNYQLLGSCAGTSGRSIAQLSKGASPDLYQHWSADLQYGASVSATAGKSYQVGAVFWVQGENDTTTSQSAYLASLAQLHTDMNTDIAAVTGQAAVPLIHYQCSTFKGTGDTPQIAWTMVQAALTLPNDYLACPTYQFDYVAGGPHMTNQSYKWMGAYMGIAYKRIVIDQLAFKPLWPVSSTLFGKIALVKFNVPVKPLVFDTTWVAAVAHMGFNIFDSSGITENVITSVSLVGPDTVKIVATNTIVPGMRLYYGNNGTSSAGRTTGSRGNLRDSQGDNLVFDGGGLNLPMHNWSVIFNWTL
jgi:hypothetical protein